MLAPLRTGPVSAELNYHELARLVAPARGKGKRGRPLVRDLSRREKEPLTGIPGCKAKPGIGAGNEPRRAGRFDRLERKIDALATFVAALRDTPPGPR
jgi:hypothetical protein